jgi:hypothetical protein
MKGWADSGGNGVVFDILRAANGTEAGNTDLAESLRRVFAEGSQDLMLGLRLQTYGPEANFPATLVNPPSGSQIETWINANNFLQGYIGERIQNGLRIQGQIFVHPPQEFTTLVIAYLVGRGMTNAQATAMAPNVNAYRDGNEMHLGLDRGETATAIHESMHVFQHDDYPGQLGFNVKEGTTEYMTRIITTQQGIPRGNFYPRQLQSIRRLVALVGRDTVADAYFEGKIGDLRTAVDDAQGNGTFNNWVTFMKNGNYNAADALL